MRRRKITWLLGLAVLFSMLLPAVPTAAQGGQRFFPETGFTVQGAFLDFFDRHGGMATFGYPISTQILEDGLIMQYFQNARFEYHPANPESYRVQLSLLGSRILGAAIPAVAPCSHTPTADKRYFPETGHNVVGAFLHAYNAYGGLTVFGYPITEAYTADGSIVQYFQRMRLEIRAGEASARLGNLGYEWLHQQFRFAVAPVTGPVCSLAHLSFYPPTPGYATPIPVYPLPGPSPVVYQPVPVCPAPGRFFPETGFIVSGDFLQFWLDNGQLDIFGYPISGEFVENGLVVQYFQRARMERHPDNPPAYRIELGLLGSELFGPPSPPFFCVYHGYPGGPDIQYFPTTGHMVSGAFLHFFNTRGGLRIFGYPITEAFIENGTIVQWFQRAKMEYHPSNPPAYQVQLALLGTLVYQSRH